MNQQKWQDYFSVRNSFLFLSLIVLPLLVTYFGISTMIQEQYKAEKDALERRLDLQAAKIPILSDDNYQFKDFFDAFFTNRNLLKSSPDDIARLIDQIDRRYPNGFKWLFWDKNGKVIKIDSSTIMEGKRSWEVLLANLMKKFNVLGNAQVFSNPDHFKRRIGYSLGMLQKAMGGEKKVEHVHGARDKVITSKWFDRDCLLHWDIDVVSYQMENIPKEIRGGCMVMAFEDALGENFWLRRMLVRRPRTKSQLPFPIVALNISDRQPFYIEDSVKFPGISEGLIRAYFNRDRDTFEFANYLIKASPYEKDTSLRIFSLADLSRVRRTRSDQLNGLRLAIGFLFILAIALAIFFVNRGNISLSLRKRIAVLFLIAVLMPVLSLISIGQVFLAHEKNRLYESAYARMENGLEALELRYKDAPQLIEKNLFNNVMSLIGSAPTSLNEVEISLKKAVEEDLFRNYIVGDVKGTFLLSNWHDIHPAIKNALKLSLKKLVEMEFDLENAQGSLVSEYMDEEIEGLLGSINASMNLARPSHLRYYCFQDWHMYFMSAALRIDGKPHGLLIHVPDYFVERTFAQTEFARNVQATSFNNELCSELSFYSRYRSTPSLPEKSVLFTRLEKVFERSFNLKVKEVGQIRIEDENFLYTIMPLRTMYRQNYIPCMLTTTTQIEQLLKHYRLAIFSLASFASLGALVLSLILAGSLLGPIQSIDAAAQKIGKGDLSVILPNMGSDELGRLSSTFNDMVKGLRERERMQAYVSDSVLEAVQDHADPNLGAGKTIQATILFSDIRNFTGLTEQYRPEKIFELLNEFLGGVEPLIRDNHGRVDKFIGDAVMAVFHHSGKEHHSLSAVKAAVVMKKFVKNLNLKRKKEGLFTINIGIGISTGTVLLGDVGSSRRKDLTVIGDEVNLAARLETASKQGQHSRIIISGTTYDLIKKHVDVVEMPFTEIRGKKTPVKIYELVKLIEI